MHMEVRILQERMPHTNHKACQKRLNHNELYTVDLAQNLIHILIS